MATNDHFTTRATHRADHLPHQTNRWTDRGDGFNVKLSREERSQELPLKDTIAFGNRTLIQKHYSPKLKKNVVVKSVESSGINDAHNEDWKEETKHLRHLEHHHIVRVLGSFTEGRFSGIILEPVAPCNLKAYLWRHASDLEAIVKMEKNHRMETSHLPRIMGCLAHALSYIHREEKVRHCDIKPENILLEGRRAMFADFGLSKAITETHSGSSGPSYKTLMYTSPERAANVHRNKSDDIFSLACVFAEIYTVSKGRTCEAFLQYREQNDSSEKGYYHNVIEPVIEWLESLSKETPERSDVQILRLLTAMFSTQPSSRPSADEVWKTLTCCTRGVSSEEAKLYCGQCCMPILSSEISRSGETVTTEERIFPMNRNSAEGSFFKTEIPLNRRPGLDWVRNVRHWNQSIIDVVSHHEKIPHLVRRRAISDGNDVQWALANNEALSLSNVNHRHMISLYGTYRQGNVLTLLYEPASKFDLRSYLELAEIQAQDMVFLVHSFGCLATALAKLHKVGFDHGDIRRENILVYVQNKRPRILFTKFSFSQRIGNGDNTGGAHRIKNYFQEFLPGRSKDHRSIKVSEIFAKKATAEYHPPDWKYTGMGQPEADIFSLGCVFIEMYTVLSGKKMGDFRKSRMDPRGAAYRYNLDATHTWLYGLEAERDYETKDTFLDVVIRMIDPDPARRPTAAEVVHILQTCKDANGQKRAGDCFVESNGI